MSHRRSAIRDRLRRRELLVANPVATGAVDNTDDLYTDMLHLDSIPLVQPVSRANRSSWRNSLPISLGFLVPNPSQAPC